MAKTDSQQTKSTSINVGDRAPDFQLIDQSGNAVQLSDLLGARTLVVYFYPADNSAGCTAEACSFRDSYQVFTDAGADVIGISTDSVATHQGFAAKHRLPFTLLSDPDGTVARRYGITKKLGFIWGRVTFVIDKDGIVQHVFSSLFQATKHVDEALAVVRRLTVK